MRFPRRREFPLLFELHFALILASNVRRRSDDDNVVAVVVVVKFTVPPPARRLLFTESRDETSRRSYRRLPRFIVRARRRETTVGKM